MKFQYFLLAGTAFAAAAVAQHPAQPQPTPAPIARSAPAGAELPLQQGEGRAVAAKLADDLVSSFVFRAQAEDYAAMLRKNAAAGRYDGGKRSDLAKLLTDDLQAVHKDGHLHVSVAEDRSGEGSGPRAHAGVPRSFPPLIQSAKTIAPGIGYIRFTAFMGRDEELAAIRKWLADNRDARTLIFDLRNHHGGGLDEMDVIFPYLFAAKTPLVKMSVAKYIADQGGVPVGDRPTMETVREGDLVVDTHSAIPGEDTPLRRATVYLLVSNASASAAEHFALALKSTGRATLIGEATAGANHFGGTRPLTDNFSVWMPVGRTYDIKTGKDWEGVGIAPDIAVDPTQALIVALEKSGLGHDQAVALNATEIPAEPVHRDKLRAR